MGTDVLDNIESVNIPKFTPQYENEPRHPFFKPFEHEIEEFSKVSPARPHPAFLNSTY